MSNQKGVVHESEYVLDRKQQIRTQSHTSIRLAINNDGATKTEFYTDNTPDKEYDSYTFYLGDDRYACFSRWHWVAVADATHDDKYRDAVSDLNAGDNDMSLAEYIINAGIAKGDLIIATHHNPAEAMRLVCEKIDNKDG